MRIHNGPVSVQRFWGLKVCIGKKIEERDCHASYAENDSALRNLFVTHCRKKWWLRFWLPCFIWSRSLLKAQIKKKKNIFVLWNFCCIMRCFLVLWFLITLQWVHDILWFLCNTRIFCKLFDFLDSVYVYNHMANTKEYFLTGACIVSNLDLPLKHLLQTLSALTNARSTFKQQ